jgi:hypothetical protein
MRGDGSAGLTCAGNVADGDRMRGSVLSCVKSPAWAGETLRNGSVPNEPWHTGLTREFGGSPRLFGQL